MKKIFFDANIIIDFLDSKSKDNLLIVEMMQKIRFAKMKMYISPTTFAIASYASYKFLRNRKSANEKLLKMAGFFYFTTEDQSVMDLVSTSNFDDLEDALQYYSAQTASPDFIITKNKKDFPKADKFIFSPYEFLYYSNYQ